MVSVSFSAAASQMIYLIFLIALGYLLAKRKLVPDDSARVLSNLEKMVLMPAMILNTFMSRFTVARLQESRTFFVSGAILLAIVMPAVWIGTHLIVKDPYQRDICTYGLTFSNYGYMGSAVVSALFPDIFLEFMVFTLTFYILNYSWGVPILLTPHENRGKGVRGTLKVMFNPIFVSMLVGMALGLTQCPIPTFLGTAILSLNRCMSPIAMLLTGMAVARMDLKAMLSARSVYVVSLIRLLGMPLLGLLALRFLPVPDAVGVCVLSMLSMPLGLNAVVIPNAYGKDTLQAAGMVLVSHVLSAVTIPLIFLLYFTMRGAV